MSSNYLSKVLKVAEAEVGYLEKASNSQLDSKTANAGSANYTKYARDLDNISGFYNGKKNGYAWCDVFVDWCFVQAYGVTEAKKLLNQPNNSYGAGCSWSAKYYKNAGQWHTTPQIGDQIFFRNYSHTGLVVDVDSRYVHTIEGNTSSAAGVIPNGGAVCKKKYQIGSSLIDGYGRPAYDTKETGGDKSVEEIAQEVLAGKWGNGATRKANLEKAGYDYDEVQKAVNALASGKTSTPAPSKPTPAPVVSKITTPKTIKECQQYLNQEYSAGLATDGIYGPATKKALVKAVQGAIGTSADGIFGANSKAKWSTIHRGDRSTKVKITQMMLLCRGYSVGSYGCDGDCGSATIDAVTRFQRNNGLSADGLAGKETAMKLFG